MRSIRLSALRSVRELRRLDPEPCAPSARRESAPHPVTGEIHPPFFEKASLRRPPPPAVPSRARLHFRPPLRSAAAPGGPSGNSAPERSGVPERIFHLIGQSSSLFTVPPTSPIGPGRPRGTPRGRDAMLRCARVPLPEGPVPDGKEVTTTRRMRGRSGARGLRRGAPPRSTLLQDVVAPNRAAGMTVP